MENNIEIKELPEYTVYYQEGIIKDMSELVPFILSSATKCKEINPNIECITPDYCYVSYLDSEFKPENVHVRYAQAVKQAGRERQ